MQKNFFFFFLAIGLHPQTMNHIKRDWSQYYTNTSEPVDGNWAQSMVTV
jgi:hypothetical protein